MSQRLVGTVVAACMALSVHVWVSAQTPHGGPATQLQPGPNVNAASGIVDLGDPAALVKADLNEQRQNETTPAASVRNPDHILAAANDYRFVDFPNDPGLGGGQNFIARLIARIFGLKAPTETRAASVGAWTGVYRSCDRGRTWLGSALPGGPLDDSEASKASPLKALSDAAEAVGAHAETTDPVLVAGPNGRMHLVVLGFVRFSNGAVGESRMYYASYTDRNNREGGTCFNYDFTQQVDTGASYITTGAPSPFIDKPSIAVTPDGTIFTAYTVFLDSVRSKVVIARSTDGGVTWTRTIPILNLGFLRNHGATLAIDPQNSNNVFVAWRLFYDNWPLMVVSRSIDRGRNFFPATPISHLFPSRSLEQIVAQLRQSRLQPFDQFTSAAGAPPTARSLAFPTLVAGVVNGQSRLYAAWTERVNVTPGAAAFGLPDGNGSPRVVFTMSSNGGLTWTARRAIDAAPRTEHLHQRGVGPMTTRAAGPQLQPIMSLSGSTAPQLLLMYYESRGELALPYGSNFISGIDRRMDVRAARINPATGALLAPSVQVSQYKIKTNSSPVQLAETMPGFPAVNRQNLPMYAGGTSAFFGDYPHIAPSRLFEYNGTRWIWATEPTSTVAMWTDSRDIEFPLAADGLPSINGDWASYTPLVPTLGGVAAPNCAHVASRNVNPYFSEIGGVVAGAAQTFKRLTIQRAFATYVENRTPEDRFFRLTIQDNEAAGLDGSFDQFDFTEARDSRDVKIFGNSGQHQSVWVQPLLSNPTASVQILVREINAIGGALTANGLRTRIVLNPDPGNNDLLSVTPGIPGYDGVTAEDSELHNPQIATPQIATFRIEAPQISSPQIATPQIATPQIATPQIATPQISTPQISTPQIATPQIATMAPGEENGTDVSYTVTNQGTTTSTYEALFNVPNVIELIGSGNYQFQVLITRTTLSPGHRPGAGGCEAVAKAEAQVLANIPVPQIATPQIATISNPQIATPQIATPQIATFSIAPYNGTEGQNSHGDDGNEDNHSTALPDQVTLTLRAIRLTPLSAGGPLFNPTEVVARVESKSTNVVFGVVEPAGSQPGTFTRPDLVVASYVPSSPALSAPAGGTATLSSWSVLNQGSATATATGGLVRLGFYLSPDPDITAADTLLGSTSYESSLVSGQSIAFDPMVLTIPIATAPGDYYIGILVDRTGDVVEGNETNNFVSEPITITAEGEGCVPPPPNMLSWWPGENNGNDIMGGRNASLFGAGFSAGKVAQAFSFNGDGDFLTIPVDAALRPSQLSVDFWFKSDVTLNSDSGSTPLLVQLENGESYTDTTRGYDFVYTNGQLRFGLRSNLGRINASHSVTIGADTWRHLTGTFDGRFQRLYLDAVQVAVIDWLALDGATFGYAPGTSTILLGQFTVGTYPSLNTEYFSGLIDEIEIFSRALASEEVLSIVGADAAGKCQDGLPLFLVVTNINDSGPGSLRQAMLTANANSGIADLIQFEIPEAPTATITPASPLPALSDPVTVDATTQNSYDTTPVIELNGGGGGGPIGLSIVAAGVTVRGLSLTDWTGAAISVTGSGSATIAGNFIGLEPDGDTVGPNGDGVVLQTAGNVVGGADLSDRNVISGNTTSGVVIDGAGATGNRVIGNYLGIAPSGIAARGNGVTGVVVNAPSNVIGEPGAGNVISGNARGVSISPGMTGNNVAANFIGTRPGGMVALGNTEIGVAVFGDNNTIGGAGPGTGNVISGNAGSGVALWRAFGGTATGNVVRGNIIGLAADGNSFAGNGNGGITITGGASNVIGGIAPGTSNIISGNGGHGVSITDPTATANVVLGNFIGTDALATSPRANAAAGVSISGNASNNNIGTSSPGGGNLISGNSGVGVSISGGTDTSNNAIRNNVIGLNGAGTGALPNNLGGVALSAPSVVGGDSASEGNVISGNGGTGIAIVADDSGSTVQGNRIGTNSAGTAAFGNAGHGISISDAEFSRIGGTTPSLRNVISGNAGSGVYISNDASATGLHGNYIGTNAAGTAAIPNTGSGVEIVDTPGVQVGASGADAGNVISGNGGHGVSISGESSSSNGIYNNKIGTNAGGTADVGNTLSGVLLTNGAHDNTVGMPAVANLISGNNENGVTITGVETTANLVYGNRIGTNAAGTAGVRNGSTNGFGDPIGAGVSIADAPANFIGSSSVAGFGNLISGGHGVGVSISGGTASGNLVQGNLIGTTASGAAALGNRFGIFNASAPATEIGGVSESDRNVISGNTHEGIAVTGESATGVLIRGNFIGTDVSGAVDLGNTFQGITVRFGAAVTIGGSRENAAQVIAGNNLSGISLETSGNTVVGNNIGTGAGGELTVGNGQSGIRITGSNNVIGGPGDLYNIVGRNGGAGIDVASGTANTIDDNVIFQNSGLGIDLGSDGVTGNDGGDGDTGANDLQNFPVVTLASRTGTGTRVVGTLNSTASTSFILRFVADGACDPSGHGQGQFIIGQTTVTTNSDGNAIFDTELPGFATIGHSLSATATGPDGSTSELSACQVVVD